MLGQEKGELDAAGKVQDAEDVGQLSLHRCFANVEIVSNLFVAGAGVHGAERHPEGVEGSHRRVN